MFKPYPIVAAIILGVTPLSLFAQKGTASSDIDLRKSHLHNETAYIPPQCYTKTQGENNRVVNGCYVCHTRSVQPNYTNDHELQLDYSLPEPGLANPWTNLFEDRQQRIAQIADQEIQKYINENNYLNEDGEIELRKKLDNLPVHWDYNKNGKWDGYTPDCYFNFDQQGFDLDPNGRETGWRSFAYYPFPGSSWPTNGSTDDISIRLAEYMRQDDRGNFDREVYLINLAIVEALVKNENVSVPPVDENRFGVDLNKDGKLGITDIIVFEWDPRQGKNMSYVGLARSKQEQGELHLAAGLFPEGTEFLQSIRYIDVDKEGNITLSNRMKELRYMKKRTWRTYSDLEEATLAEMKEREDFPDRIKQIIGNGEQGINNGTGWLLQGFIEDRTGELRPQDFEETVSCIGCHGGVGITTDSVYGFPRKLDGSHHQRGWYHWSQKGMKGLAEPKIEIHGAGVYYEYSYYLMYNPSGNEFRNNPEVAAKFYNNDGTVRMQMLDLLHDNIAILVNPTQTRALTLNKAYKTIVEDQDYHQGREVNITPLATTVYENITQSEPTGVQQPTSTDKFGPRFGAECLSSSIPAIDIEPVVKGRGMSGPSGVPYEADWHGIIHKSKYAIDVPGVHFTFPTRLTLPTRVIVPNGNNPSCYTCHRLSYPTVPRNIKKTQMLDLTEMASTSTLQNGVTQLTQNKGQDQNPVWSPDGKQVAFVSDRSGSSQIWLMKTDGSEQKQLSGEADLHAWPQWSPDSREIVAWSYNQDTKTYAIKLFEIDKRTEKVLVDSREMLDRPVFHPDGKTISYGAQTQGNWDIWLVSPESGKTLRLTIDPIMESNPHWRADGKVLSYKVAPTTGAYSLTGENFMTFEIGYEKPTIHQWQGPESVQMNDWSPDGSKIAYTAEAITNASGKEQVSYLAMVSDIQLENDKAITSRDLIISKGCTLGDRGPVFSPDGTRIAFWAWNRDNTASIWLYDTVSDQAQPITSGGIDMYPQWSPDGSSIIFESNNYGQTDIMSISVPRSDKG